MSAILGTSQYNCYFNQGPDNPATTGKDCQGPRPDVQGGITASMAGGSWLGALMSGYITDLFGRKKAVMIGAVIWCIGSILCCAAQNIGVLLERFPLFQDSNIYQRCSPSGVSSTVFASVSVPPKSRSTFPSSRHPASEVGWSVLSNGPSLGGS